MPTRCFFFTPHAAYTYQRHTSFHSNAKHQPQNTQMPNTQLHLPPTTATLTSNTFALTAHALRLLLYLGSTTKVIPWPRMCRTLRGTLSQLYQHPNATPNQRLSSARLRYQGVL